MNKSTLLALLVFFQLPAHASVSVSGEILPAEMNPEQTCKIKSHSLSESYTCSATLIGEKTLLTAAHCKAGFDFRVGCKAKDGTVYQSKVAQFLKIEGTLDLAIVELKTPIPITPMKLVTSLAETENLLRSKQCRFSGWSEGNKLTSVEVPLTHTYTLTKKMNDTAEMILNTQSGEEILKLGQSAKIENISFNTTAEHPTLEGSSKNSIAHGDSGGSTFCLNEKYEPVLIGVNRAGNGTISDSVAIGTDAVQNWIFQLGTTSN